MMDRREVIQTGGAAGGRRARGRTAAGSAQRRPAGATRFFPGFKPFKVKTTGAEINGVIGGSGSAASCCCTARRRATSRGGSSRRSWRRTRTVVVPDLRGYGDSSKPPDGENHVNYSKRAMALDQVEVMKHFGFDALPGDRPGSRRPRDPPAAARSPRTR